MGKVLDAWKQFKTQLSTDTALLAIVKKWKFNRMEEQFLTSDFGLIIAYPLQIPAESFIAVPKQKMVDLTIQVFGKVYNTSGDLLEENILSMDEKIKNAIEKDLTLSGKGTISNIGLSSFNILGEGYAETSFQCIITSLRFTVGAR